MRKQLDHTEGEEKGEEREEGSGVAVKRELALAFAFQGSRDRRCCFHYVNQKEGERSGGGGGQ